MVNLGQIQPLEATVGDVFDIVPKTIRVDPQQLQCVSATKDGGSRRRDIRQAHEDGGEGDGDDPREGQSSGATPCNCWLHHAIEELSTELNPRIAPRHSDIR